MRKRRQYSKTGFYHIVARGVNRQNIFFDDADRIFFIALLRKYSKKYMIKMHAYCLMDNHVHLEIEDLKSNVSLFMQCVCSVYARYFNRKYDRIGHLFQERYASEIILDRDYFLTVFRYILQNPAKANICKFDEYRWSSYHCYQMRDTFVDKDLILQYFKSPGDIYDFVSVIADKLCLEIEIKYSEKEKNYIERIKRLLNTDNPIINPELSRCEINKKVKLLKENGFSINTIVRVTGISKHIVQIA